MRRRLLRAGLTVLLLVALPAGADAAATGRILVLTHPHHRAAAAAAGARIASAAPVRLAGPQVPEIGLVTVRPRAGISVAAALSRLRGLPGVRAVAREHRASLRLTPNDPALTRPEPDPGGAAGTTVEWWPAREGFPSAWARVRPTAAKVGVIDTGFDATHPELAGRVVKAIDHDDTPGAGPATTDEEGHGTHVSSLACANTNDGRAMAGAGWGCRLVVVKSDLSDASIAAALVDATKAGVEAINMSFGDDSGASAAAAVQRALDYAVAHDVVLVAAAADSPKQQQGEPANALQPTGTGGNLAAGRGLSVTAADIANRRAPFAGYGSQISLAAYGAYDPGDGGLLGSGGSGPPGIFGAVPARAAMVDGVLGCTCRTTFDGDARYAYLAGTSMAAPQVAAAAALVRVLNPDLGGLEVVRLLKRTARRSGGWGPDLGWGILDAGAAAAAAATIDRRPPRTRTRAPKRARRGHVITVRFTAVDTAPKAVHKAGVRRVRLYASRNGGRARRLFTAVKRRSVRYRPRRTGSYRFWTLGEDRAGNREKRPRVRARTRVRR